MGLKFESTTLNPHIYQIFRLYIYVTMFFCMKQNFVKKIRESAFWHFLERLVPNRQPVFLTLPSPDPPGIFFPFSYRSTGDFFFYPIIWIDFFTKMGTPEFLRKYFVLHKKTTLNKSTIWIFGKCADLGLWIQIFNQGLILFGKPLFF